MVKVDDSKVLQMGKGEGGRVELVAKHISHRHYSEPYKDFLLQDVFSVESVSERTKECRCGVMVEQVSQRWAGKNGRVKFGLCWEQ